jgi:hypothetical protein
MARQIIGIGAAAGDGTGDPARTAFGKVNDMTAELYATLATGVAFPGILVLPGVSVGGVGTQSVAQNQVSYGFIRFDKPGTITGVHSEVTTAATSGAYKMLVYRANKACVIGAQVYESAEMDASTTGVRSATGLTISVAAGEILALAGWHNGTSHALRTFLGNAPDTMVTDALGSSPLATRLRCSLSYAGSAPDPGPAITTVDYSNTGFRHFVVPEVTYS